MSKSHIAVSKTNASLSIFIFKMFHFDIRLSLFLQSFILFLIVATSFAFNPDYPRTSEDINAIFIKHKIVPDVIPLAPEHIMRIEYTEDIEVDYGNYLEPYQMFPKPETMYWPVDREEYYTLIMTDPDAPSAEHPTQREWQHWIVVNIPELKISKGEEITDYIGMVSSQINSFHRYVFLVYKHPHRTRIPFTEQHIGDKYKVNFSPNDTMLVRANFSTHKFAEKYKLGRPFAGNFCYGRWNVTVGAPPTSSTLHPFDVWGDFQGP